MKNFFEIFNLPPKFALDLDDLEKKYFTFQQQFHPDNSSTADIEQSILINNAYKVLSTPIPRASYILQLNGINLEDDSQAPKPDSVTLAEILELQEIVAEITPDKIEELKKELTTKIKSLLDDAALNLDNKDFNKAAQILIRAKYFEKIVKNLKAKKTLL